MREGEHLLKSNFLCQKGSPSTWSQLKCVLIRPFSFTSRRLSALSPSLSGEEDGSQTSFCCSNQNQKGRSDFQALGSCSSFVPISSKKSSLINLSSRQTCDPLRARPLKWNAERGLQKPRSVGETVMVPSPSSSVQPELPVLI